MTDFDEIDFFTDDSLVADPYPYFAHQFATCPITKEPFHDVTMVTGYSEALEIYHDTDSFGHGIHVCPGAPLARAEARVSLERLLDRMSSITISEGPAGSPSVPVRTDIHPSRPRAPAPGVPATLVTPPKALLTSGERGC